MRIARRIGSVVVATALVGAGITVVAGAPAATAATAAVAPTPPEPKPVKATAHKADPRPAAPSDKTDPAWLNAKVTVPSAAAYDLVIPAKGLVHAGTLPVEIGAAKSGLRPARVRVRMLSQAEVTAANGLYLGFEVIRADGGAAPATASVSLDYAGIARAFGGDFATRLRVVRTCPGCDATPIPVKNDLDAMRLTVQVPVKPDPLARFSPGENVATAPSPDSGFGPQLGADRIAAVVQPTSKTVYAVSSAASGSAGDFSASKVEGSDQWNVGLGSGAFTYSYPFAMPPAVAGAVPSLALQYNSQGVDGRTTSSNNQASQVGEGWSLEPGYVERRFHSCADEGGGGDLCWSANNEYFISFAGVSGELIKNPLGGSNEWRVRGNDPAWRVLSYTGSANGDNDGEVFVAIMPDGTKYWFGSGTEPRPSGVTRPQTKAAFTVPVIAGSSAEPCYNTTASLSWCQQAYRWNVDRVLDPNDNVTSYFYDQETNYYARQGSYATQYVRAGMLDHVEYGKRSGSEATVAPAKVTVGTSLRCTAQASCPAVTVANGPSYPDVPVEQKCTSSTSCPSTMSSPTFFSEFEVTNVTTWVWNSASYSDVTSYDMTYTFPATGDTTSPSLWLQQVTSTGVASGAAAALPPLVFGGTPLQNRVITNATTPAMNKYRLWYINTELGGRIYATYGMPHDCGTTIPAWNTNATDCFPAWEGTGFTAFRKYLVTKTVTHDGVGGQPDQRVDYEYLDTPAWHYQDSLLTAAAHQSWSDFRGHARVRITGDPGGTTARTQTEYLLFRGMHGDKLSGTTAKTVPQLVDHTGTGFNDNHYLAGMPLEEQRFALDGSAYEWTFHRYWATQTFNGPDGFQSHDTQYVRESSRTDRVKNSTTASSWIGKQTDTTFSTFSGMPTRITDLGNVSVTGDGTCTDLAYTNNSATDLATPNGTEWFIDLPHTRTTYLETCGTGAVQAKTETSYDLNALAATPTEGNVTTIAAYSAAATKSVTKRTYDNYGRIETTQSPNSVASSGGVTTTAYSPNTGYPYNGVTTTDPLGHHATVKLAFAWGTPAEITDFNDFVTKIDTDALGRTVSVTRPGDAAGTPSLTFAYDISAAWSSKITSRRLLTGTTYVASHTFLDGLGRTIETQTPSARANVHFLQLSTVRYDAQGRKAAESTRPVNASGVLGYGPQAPDPATIPFETRFGYDSGGRQTSVAQYAAGVLQSTTTTAFYGPFNRVTPPLPHYAIDYYTDVDGRTSKVQEYPTTAPSTPPQTPAIPTIVTQYGYTPLGDLATVTDNAAHVTSYEYDWLRRRTKSTDPDQGEWNNTYDADGNLLTSTDAKPETVRYAYDAADRKTDAYAVGTPDTLLAHWAYDTAGNGIGKLASTTRQAGSDAYSTSVVGYDNRGRPTSKKWTIPTSETGLGGDYAYSYTYDSSDNLRDVTFPDAGGLGAETVTTGYNDSGMPTTLTGAAAYITGTTYRGDGRTSIRTLGMTSPAITRNYYYESAESGRLSRINTINGGSTPIEDLNYAYDDDNNVTSVVDAIGGTGGVPQTECFLYDRLSRLTDAFTAASGCAAPNHAAAPAYDLKYAYDDLGNMTSATTTDPVTNAPSVTAFAYAYPGHAHAVSSVNGAAYTYDANGATRTRPGLTANDLTWDRQHQLVATAGAAASTFVYDADGNRLIRRTGSTRTLYIDGMEITSDGTTTEATRYYSNVALRRRAAGVTTTTVLLRDNQNSATTTVDAGSGAVLRQKYLPYGEHRPGTDDITATDRGFLDKTEDPTGLVAVGARYYDPTIAHFVSVDPLAAPNNPQSLAGYSYADGNPTSRTDPSGLRPGCNDDEQDCGKVLDDYANRKYTEVLNNAPENIAKEKKTAKQKAARRRYAKAVIKRAITTDIKGLSLAEQSVVCEFFYWYCNDEIRDDPITQAVVDTVLTAGIMGAYNFATGAIESAVVSGAASAGDSAASGAATTASESAIARAVRLGRAGEDFVGVNGPKRAIQALVSGAARRIPDMLTDSLLLEVKNVAKMGLTGQIRDFAAYSAQEGLEFQLITRTTTVIEPALANFMRDAGFSIVKVL
jgi:RHS repeat-associated protein